MRNKNLFGTNIVYFYINVFPPVQDIGRRLKRDAKVMKGVTGPDNEMRHLQLFRHEMHHFVESLQSYIAHEVSVNEKRTSKKTDVPCSAALYTFVFFVR